MLANAQRSQTCSLPSLVPRKAPPIKSDEAFRSTGGSTRASTSLTSGVAANQSRTSWTSGFAKSDITWSSGRGADFWEGVEDFMRREQVLRSQMGSPTASPMFKSASSSALRFGGQQFGLDATDAGILGEMGYKGPLYWSAVNRDKKQELLRKQASGDLKQLRSSLRSAQLHMGPDDPLVKRLRGSLKEVDWGIRTVKQEQGDLQTLSKVMARMNSLDLGHRLWDEPVLAAARDRYMAWKAACLRSEVPETRKSACDDLAAMGDSPGALQVASMPRVEHPAARYALDLAALFGDSQRTVRQAAISACISIGEEGASAAATKLDDPESHVRRTACEALGLMGINGTKYGNLLVERLGDSDPEVRRLACVGIKKLAVPNVASAVGACVHDEEPSVRREVCNTLATMGEAAEPFTESFGLLMEDEDKDVRESAGEALRSLGGIGLATLRQAEARVAAAALARCKEESTSEDRLGAIASLATMGMRRSIAMFAFTHPDGSRPQTAQTASSNAAEQYASEVAACFGDEDPEVRKAAILAFPKVVGPDTAPELANDVVKHLGDEDESIRLATLDALVKMDAAGAAHVDAMAAHLDDSSKNVRKAVVEAIGASAAANPASIQHVMKVAAMAREEDQELQDAAQQALSNMGQAGAAVSSTINMDAEDESVQLAAMEKFGELSMFQVSKRDAEFRKKDALLAGAVAEHTDWDDDAFGPPKPPVVQFQEEVEEIPVEKPMKKTFSGAKAWKKAGGLAKMMGKFKKKPELEEDAEAVPKRAWRSGASTFSGATTPAFQQMSMAKVVDEAALEAERAAKAEEEAKEKRRLDAIELQSTKKRDRAAGDLRKFLVGYSKEDLFSRDQLEAKEGRVKEELTDDKLSSLDKYLGAPDRRFEFNELLYVAFTSLKSRLRDQRPHMVIAACNALSTFNANAEDIAPQVAPLLWDENFDIYLAARRCLVAIAGVGVDEVNKFDREKRALKKQAIVRFMVATLIKASPPYIERWAPKDTAFQVGTMDYEGSSGAAQSNFFSGSTTDINQAGKVTQLDMSDWKSYLLASDNPDYVMDKDYYFKHSREMMDPDLFRQDF